MKIYRLKREQTLTASLDEVFAFFADAHNLETITPPLLKFQVLTPAPIQMNVGTLIDYKLRIHGLPMRWQSRISVWDPPHCFVDEQLRGPYRKWHHTHTFETTDQGTHCRDIVDYAVPGGAIVHQLMVKRDVNTIFNYRRRILAQTFGEVAT